jgi:hypothetical protein
MQISSTCSMQILGNIIETGMVLYLRFQNRTLIIRHDILLIISVKIAIIQADANLLFLFSLVSLFLHSPQ